MPWPGSTRNPCEELWVALPVIPGFQRLILYLSPNAVIKCLSQLPVFSFYDCVAAAHFSHASPQCQQCATCFTANYCTTEPKHLHPHPPNGSQGRNPFGPDSVKCTRDAEKRQRRKTAGRGVSWKCMIWQDIIYRNAWWSHSPRWWNVWWLGVQSSNGFVFSCIFCQP